MKTIWKATVCIVAVLLSFSIYSCGDDDDDAVGSRDLLLGTWNGVYYLSQEWEDGEKVSAVSYTHLRAHETRHHLVCRLLLEKKKKTNKTIKNTFKLLALIDS